MRDREFLEKAVFDIEISIKNETGTGIHTETGLSYADAKFFLDKYVSESGNDTLVECYKTVCQDFGFIGHSKNGVGLTVRARAPRVTVTESETQTCPAREGFGPWKRESDLDTWEMRGNDLCCSFCGSIKPSRVIELVKEFGSSIIDPGKAGKYYVSRKSVPNAGFGGIKFYTYHFSPEEIEAYNAVLRDTKESSAK